MDEDGAGALGEGQGLAQRVLHAAAVQDDLRPVTARRLHLGQRRTRGHDHGGRAASSSAAKATPWAWLPALAATTPRARSASDSLAIRKSAPRTLNDPVRCRFSHFRKTGPPISLRQHPRVQHRRRGDHVPQDLARGDHVIRGRYLGNHRHG